MELLDIYDNNGNPTGRKIIRGDKTEVLNENEHIAVAVIFIENSNNQFLIQKTSALKGGEYSSTGGHIDSGETPIKAIKREVEEELGVNVDNDNIIYYGFLLYDMPIRYLFYLRKDININDLKLQTEEVDYVKFMSIDEINKLIKDNKMLKSHGIMFQELLKRRNNNE